MSLRRSLLIGALIGGLLLTGFALLRAPEDPTGSKLPTHNLGTAPKVVAPTFDGSLAGLADDPTPASFTAETSTPSTTTSGVTAPAAAPAPAPSGGGSGGGGSSGFGPSVSGGAVGGG